MQISLSIQLKLKKSMHMKKKKPMFIKLKGYREIHSQETFKLSLRSRKRRSHNQEGF
jgi:hypothetical protein